MSDKEPTGRLRDLIKSVRECKTAAEERAVVAKESADIRAMFADKSSKFRHRSVAKLLFIQMMGYPTNFGQVECVNLIASGNFTEKRVGYLGLTQLLNEKDDVLILVENIMQIDMNSSNNQIVGMALTAFANIATSEMCRDLCKDITKLMRHSNSYIRKKAILAGSRVVWKCPDMVEDLIPEVPRLLEDRSHVVVMCAVSYLLEIIKIEGIDGKRFEGHLSLVVRALRNLMHTVHSPEHTIGGIIDPFLQVNLIKLIGKISVGDLSEEVVDCLAQVATNTDSSKNPGNSVLYECVRTIMDVQSTSGLRVLATNIMGRFLLNRDNNLRYVALNSLLKLVKVDLVAVQRHKATILDCLKDVDLAIKRKALDLTYALINESNLRQVVEELVTHLNEAERDFKEAIVSKICFALETHSSDKKWHFDIILTVLKTADVPEEVVSSTAHIISACPEIHSYATHKLIRALNESAEQSGVVLLAVWSIGEFGNLLIREGVDSEEGRLNALSENELISALEPLLGSLHSSVTKEYVLTALIKLSTRVPTSKGSIERLLGLLSHDINVELQQRACEYLQLLNTNWDNLRGPLLEKMPVFKKQEAGEQVVVNVEAPKTDTAGIFDLIFDSEPPSNPTPSTNPALIPDFDVNPSSITNVNPGSIADPLMEIFGSLPSPAPTQPPQYSQSLQSLEPSEVFPPAQSSMSSQLVEDFQDFVPVTSPPISIIAYQDSEIYVNFNCTKQETNDTQIDVFISNSSPSPIYDFRLSVATQKHLELKNLQPASGTTMEPSGNIYQKLTIYNSMRGTKPIVLKVKVEYKINSEQRDRVAIVDQFPADY